MDDSITIGQPIATIAATSPLTRLLRLFGDIRQGEAPVVLLLVANIFVTLAGYYVCKTVREPLILISGGAAMKTYASAGQALLLMGFIPLYSWFASRVDRTRLLLGLSMFFIVNLELFWAVGHANVPNVGIAFYVWVGIFSNAVIAQFWSYGNDLFDKPTGERLFPIIAIGMTLGSPLGAAFAEALFARRGTVRAPADRCRLPGRLDRVVLDRGAALETAQRAPCGAITRGRQRLCAARDESVSWDDLSATPGAESREHHGRIRALQRRGGAREPTRRV